jgi:hypothetical protein
MRTSTILLAAAGGVAAAALTYYSVRSVLSRVLPSTPAHTRSPHAVACTALSTPRPYTRCVYLTSAGATRGHAPNPSPSRRKDERERERVDLVDSHTRRKGRHSPSNQPDQ